MSVTSVRDRSGLEYSAEFAWPGGFDRIPDDEWTRQPVDQFGLSYDSVGGHGWYKNLEPTIAQVLAALDPGKLLIDYSSGTGILTRRLLEKIHYPVGLLNVDASAKFLRVALENFSARRARRLPAAALAQAGKAAGAARRGRRHPDHRAWRGHSHLDQRHPSLLRPRRHAGVVGPRAAARRPRVRLLGEHAQPGLPSGNWIIDDTVAKVNQIAADLVATEPAFEEYRPVLADSARMASHGKLRDKVFVPVRPLGLYVKAFEEAGFTVLHVFDETIYARIDEWYQLLSTYHDGVLSWVGGSEKVEGAAPSAAAVRDRLFLIRYSLDKLFPGQDSFPCAWSYLTCRK